MRKGTTLRIALIIVLKRLYLRNYNSYEFQTWHQYSSITLLYSLGILNPSHFQCGRASDYVDRIQNSPFYASLWWLLVQDWRLVVASNVGSVK